MSALAAVGLKKKVKIHFSSNTYQAVDLAARMNRFSCLKTGAFFQVGLPTEERRLFCQPVPTSHGNQQGTRFLSSILQTDHSFLDNVLFFIFLMSVFSRGEVLDGG